MAEPIILTVSDCVAFINQTLEYAYPIVVVEGEVNSFKTSKQKFIFFDIKDEAAVLSCFMMVFALRTPLEDGMRVRVTAVPRLTAWGKFSLTVREVVPVGEGSIKRSFELLRAKLEKEGLFDADRKRPLPVIPERVGVISSTEAAGYADFIKILHNRWSGLDITVADVQVQGANAGGQLIRAVRYFNEQPELVDVLVLVRGGGSTDDLAVFNEELLVRAVAASRIPILIGVGHETDTSLCDLVADRRAATPSNAAELLVPDKRALRGEITHLERRMLNQLGHRHQALKLQLGGMTRRLLEQIYQQLQGQQRHVAYAEWLLRQLDPKAILRRGYSLVRDEQGRLIRGNANNIKLGAKLTIELERAIIKVGVQDVEAS